MVHEPTEYHIRVRGLIDPERAQWFGSVQISHTANGETLMVAMVRDQAELFGLLMRVRDLCLVLLSVDLLQAGPSGAHAEAAKTPDGERRQ